MIKIIDIYLEGVSEEEQAKAKEIAEKVRNELYSDLADGAKINLYLIPKIDPVKMSINIKTS